MVWRLDPEYSGAGGLGGGGPSGRNPAPYQQDIMQLPTLVAGVVAAVALVVLEDLVSSLLDM